MPYDLAAVERGYGECEAEWNGHRITLRYRVDLDGRAVHALRRAMVGSQIAFGGPNDRVPDTDAVMAELVRVLLPCGPEIPEGERGWDITREDVPVPVSVEEMERLPPMMPVQLLSAVVRDVNDPNRRRLSLSSSRARADSPPTASPTTTASSATPNGQASPPGLSLVSATTPADGPAGLSGYGA